MKIRILGSASRDLMEGYRFYDRRPRASAAISSIRYIPTWTP